MDEDDKIAKWWNLVNESFIISGCVNCTDWDELWEEAQEEVRKVYRSLTEEFPTDL